MLTQPRARALVTSAPDDSIANALQHRGISVTQCDPGAVNAARVGGVQADEDALPFPTNSFDLIVSCGTLDTVNDVPGALVRMRHLLVPDGLLLAAFVGGRSLNRMRAALLAADGDSAAQRVHPMIDVRAMGDLLMRAGYAMPVVDSVDIPVRHSDLLSLCADLRGMGGTNVLASPPPPLTRGKLARAMSAFAGNAGTDGKVSEMFTIIHASAWRPHPSQPQPARRGSATASLSDALKSGSPPPA